jgi:hypothetical protein
MGLILITNLRPYPVPTTLCPAGSHPWTRLTARDGRPQGIITQSNDTISSIQNNPKINKLCMTVICNFIPPSPSSVPTWLSHRRGGGRRGGGRGGRGGDGGDFDAVLIEMHGMLRARRRASTRSARSASRGGRVTQKTASRKQTSSR